MWMRFLRSGERQLGVPVLLIIAHIAVEGLRRSGSGLWASRCIDGAIWICFQVGKKVLHVRP